MTTVAAVVAAAARVAVVEIEVPGKIIAHRVRRFEWIIPPKMRMDLDIIVKIVSILVVK